jgi:uncharacterized delta-60 repeat protein
MIYTSIKRYMAWDNASQLISHHLGPKQSISQDLLIIPVKGNSYKPALITLFKYIACICLSFIWLNVPVYGQVTPGTFDLTFDTGNILSSSVRALVLQPDGKVLVGGQFTEFDGTTRNRIARLNNDGSLDASFNPGTGFDNIVHTLALQPDGKVLVGGYFIEFDGTTRNRIARLNNDGSLDASFNPGTGFNNLVNALVLQPDGKVIVGGKFISYDGSLNKILVRLDDDGSLDNSFVPASTIRSQCDLIDALYVTSDGKILVGASDDNEPYIYRIEQNGELDLGFNNVRLDRDGLFIKVFHELTNGKILVGGEFEDFSSDAGNNLVRLNSDGYHDMTFFASTSSRVNALAMQPDGKLLLGGDFSTPNGRRNVVRIFGEYVCPPEPEPINIIASSQGPIQVNTSITLIADFENSNLLEATWDWGDGTTTEGTIASSKVTGMHNYTDMGVYTATLTILDQCDNQPSEP